MLNGSSLQGSFELHSDAPLSISQRISYGLIATAYECLIYFSMPFFQWRQAYTLPRSGLDAVISFDVWGVIPYVSLYILILYAFLKSPSVAVWRLCKNICIVASIAAFFYFFFPTQVGRVDVVMGDDILSQILVLLYHIDTPFNCFPSQHCAIAVLCVAALMDKDKVENSVYFIWGLLIIWSTIAVQQHVSIDAISGAALGLSIYWLGNRTDRNKNHSRC